MSFKQVNGFQTLKFGVPEGTFAKNTHARAKLRVLMTIFRKFPSSKRLNQYSLVYFNFRLKLEDPAMHFNTVRMPFFLNLVTSYHEKNICVIGCLLEDFVHLQESPG